MDSNSTRRMYENAVRTMIDYGDDEIFLEGFNCAIGLIAHTASEIPDFGGNVDILVESAIAAMLCADETMRQMREGGNKCYNESKS